jgi:hypothetical protein
LRRFLAMDNYVSCRLMRTVLLPLCLADGIVSREKLRQELIRSGAAGTLAETGTALATIAGQIRGPNRAYLRQVIRYDKNEDGQIEHLRIPDEYKPLVREVLDSLEQDDISEHDADEQGQLSGGGEQST